MYEYGTAPESDEIEISIFGLGYGEAISVHLGEQNWLLVDSCLSPQSKIPATLEYLEKIGVPLSNVHTIIASHWHDDHVKGLTSMVERCLNSTLFISGAFNKKEALAFLSAYGGQSVAAHTAGAKELYRAVLASQKPVQFTNHRTLIWEGKILGRKMRAVAFSPTPEASAQSLAHMTQLLPTLNDPIKHVTELKPNLEAIVVSVDFGDDAILLGSDLEDHGRLGWTSILNNSWCLNNQKASAYKIAHHGSSTGDHPDIWTNLLTSNPIAALTPFTNGGVRLPLENDRNRILSKTENAFVSSDGSRRPQMEKSLIQRMSALAKKITPVNTGFGVIRLRKKMGEKEWKIDLFGQAKKMEAVNHFRSS